MKQVMHSYNTILKPELAIAFKIQLLPSLIDSNVADDQLFLDVIYPDPPPRMQFFHVIMISLPNYSTLEMICRENVKPKKVYC